MEAVRRGAGISESLATSMSFGTASVIFHSAASRTSAICCSRCSRVREAYVWRNAGRSPVGRAPRRRAASAWATSARVAAAGDEKPSDSILLRSASSSAGRPAFARRSSHGPAPSAGIPRSAMILPRTFPARSGEIAVSATSSCRSRSGESIFQLPSRTEVAQGSASSLFESHAA
jgi:hypothetical protein